MTTSDQQLRDHVRDRYAAAALSVASGSAASCCGPTAAAAAPQTSCCGPSDALSAISDTDEAAIFGAALYTSADTDGLPEQAVLASLGCGNPLAVAELRAGERVLDLGSGGGIDVLLSARRVGPTGFAYGLDMTDEMLALARVNAAKAGAANVEFIKGQIEAIPLPDGSIDVVISNCVINLSTDKPAVLAEMFRVLTPGGRIGISDVVAEDQLSHAERAKRGSYVGCIAGALSRTEYLDGLAAVGFTDPQVVFTHEAAPGMHGAIVRAVKPATAHLEALMSSTPAVLFVCVKNGGKSQMAAGLMRRAAGNTVTVDSAGTEPGGKINGLSAQVLLEVGVDITDQTPKKLTEDMIVTADRVIVLGRDAQVSSVGDTPVEVWDTDEPSERGIEGAERMRLVRDDIARRVDALANQLRR